MGGEAGAQAAALGRGQGEFTCGRRFMARGGMLLPKLCLLIPNIPWPRPTYAEKELCCP